MAGASHALGPAPELSQHFDFDPSLIASSLSFTFKNIRNKIKALY